MGGGLDSWIRFVARFVLREAYGSKFMSNVELMVCFVTIQRCG